MRTMFLTLAGTAALTIAAPAMAQSNLNANAGIGISNRIAQMETRINAGVRTGEIDRRESRALRYQLGQLQRMEQHYLRDGLTAEERRDLQQRLRMLRQDVRLADGRGNGYDRWDDDQYTGQGGPLEGDGWVVDDSGGSRSGFAGLFDNFLGRGGMQVGQQVTGNLYAVPGEYRTQFRDNNRAYFRSDGNRIYEIDADTHTIVRIFSRDE
jgi:hypothetical protein